MEDGLYELLITTQVEADLAAQVDAERLIEAVPEADQPHVLARHLYDVALRRLRSTRDQQERLRVTNKLMRQLESGDDQIAEPTRQLLSLAKSATWDHRHVARPRTPLSEAALLTNTKGEPSLGSELRSELDSCNDVDLLCAFVKWYGIRVLEPELRRLDERGTPFRVITTTYLGATEREALDRLVREFGATVKVQYDAQRTRLHAKAWMFRRHTGFDTAYVGSSNLSRTALLEGVEWNVRLSHVGTPALLEKFRATFDTYWNDPSFETYEPDRDRDRLDDALAEAAGRRTSGRVTISLSGLQVRPLAHQQEMLEALAVERGVHDRHRNLVVAATGTGKTVVAALDYRSMVDKASGRQPSLLFVAHRSEILEQSLRTYREVLSDADFGELYVAGARPERWRHVFASVQSLTAYGVPNLPADAFDVVVIDEFHHAAAATYRRILDHLQPTELLGLTATPERADGTNVADLFGGRIATELRLWDALGNDLLCPFHYFAVADGTDLRRVDWSRGRYDEQQLSNLYTGNDARAAIVLKQLQDKILNPGGMRALGFCVSVAHAEFMAAAFNRAGVPARAVSGATSPTERERALLDLRARRVNALFAADLYNEGLDLPEVDTVLFLRPTESATIFLQQLGRGLRRTRDKAVLTVLDFVGYHRREFRFDTKLRALTGLTRLNLQREIERGFGFLPSGCQIVMDKQSQAIVLENVRSQIAQRWPQMVAELRASGDVDLSTFLSESGIGISDVLRGGARSWTELRRAAGLPTRQGSAMEQRLLKRIRALAHVDDPIRVATYRQLLREDASPWQSLSSAEQRFAQMLVFSLWPEGGGFSSYDEALAALRSEAAVRDELSQVIDLSFDAARHRTTTLGPPLNDVPLEVHGRYQREEVLAALGYASFDRKPNSFREGVLHVPERSVDAFFVTLTKSEADYSPTTMYQDYPISPTLFHWESQSTTSVASPTGQRYVNGTSTVLLFVRSHKADEFGTAPYLFLGPATYVEHTGDRPIAITWRLEVPMPADFFSGTTVVAS